MIDNLERRIRLRWMYASLVDNRDVYSADLYTRTAATLIQDEGRLTNRIELAPALNEYSARRGDYGVIVLPNTTLEGRFRK